MAMKIPPRTHVQALRCIDINGKGTITTHVKKFNVVKYLPMMYLVMIANCFSRNHKRNTGD